MNKRTYPFKIIKLNRSETIKFLKKCGGSYPHQKEILSGKLFLVTCRTCGKPTYSKYALHNKCRYAEK